MGVNIRMPQGNASAQSNESWKATGFVNLWVKRTDGSKFKLGAIPLREQKTTDAAIINRLRQEGGVEALLNALEVDYQDVNNDPSKVNVGF